MESKTLIQKIISFRQEAGKADYSSSDPKSWKKESDNSTTIIYKSGDWKSEDNFFGGEPYGGREVVFYKGKPVWIFVYYGWVEPNVSDIQEVYDFLKAALNADSENKVFRGPKEFVKGNFLYKNSWHGNFERFSGEEIMYRKGTEIYRAKYMGGLVDQRKDEETN